MPGIPTDPVSLSTTVTSYGQSALMSMFSSAGVSPSFFHGIGSFFSFLDNSTGQWKSRLAKMTPWTPDQRLSWYIALINNIGEFHDAVQYAEMFGARAEQIDDRGKCSIQLYQAFNNLVLYKFFGGDVNGKRMDGIYERSYQWLKNDIPTTAGGIVGSVIGSVIGGTKPPVSTGGVGGFVDKLFGGSNQTNDVPTVKRDPLDLVFIVVAVLGLLIGVYSAFFKGKK